MEADILTIYRDSKKLCDYIEKWIANHFSSCGIKGAVLGISGGVDSSLLAALLTKALGPENTIGVIMPCHSMPIDEEYALLLSKTFGFKTKKADLSQCYDDLFSILIRTMGSLDNLSAANIKPRLRMTTLYAIAQQNSYLVCGATNKDELMYGYFTKHGDSGVDVLPLANLLKGEVKLMASYIGVPYKLIERAPTAGLWNGQTDEMEMGLTYKELDNYFFNGEASLENKIKIDKAVQRSIHKRNFPVIAEIPNDI